MSADTIVAAGCALGAVLLSASWTRLLCNPSSRLYILDYPNHRSLHTQPTPRTGGIAICAAVLLAGGAWLLYTDEQWARLAALAASATSVTVVSFIDDRRTIQPHYRLLAHFAAGIALLLSGFVVRDNWLPGPMGALPHAAALAATLIYIVWMLELYNFMDGMDGFAGGMAVVGFSSLAILSGLGGAHLVSGLSLIIAAAALGFLFLNFPPARIFMGDVGSATLGFLAAALSVWGAQSGAFPMWAAILIFSPFIVDATVTLGRRAVRREKIWQPHKTHYYQRLVQIGWSHRKVVLSEYVLMGATSVSAIWVVRQPIDVQWALLLAWVLIYGSAMGAVSLIDATHGGRVVGTGVRNVSE